MKIGDLFFGIKGEWAEFQKAAQVEGTKAGKVAGDATSKGFNVGKLAVTAFSAAATGGFALAAKGAMELERVQGDYAAATGASTAEAKAFAAQVNGMRGSNTQSLQEIARAGTQVAQQFQLTGEAGKALTQDFLTFARVTHQDAAGAVDSFDKALDAFGEPASRATSLMDQLVASNQRFGTDAGPAAVAALADMAPALQAMGKGLDYGVGLLNLFEKSGIDAGSATMSLNRAVKALKPGQTLDDLIAELGRIEDPLLRGQRAMELFGKGGAKMANAIKPGMTSLADFEVSAESAAGTFDKAGTAMLTTSDKIRMELEKLKAGFAAVGQEFGPLATGAAAVVPLGAKVGGSLAMMATGATTATAAFTALAVALGPLVIALGALVAIGWVISESQKQSATYTADLAKQTGIATDTTEGYVDALREQEHQTRIAAAGGDLLRLAYRNAADELRSTGTTAADARKELARLGWTPAEIAAFEAGPKALASSIGGLASPLDNAALAARGVATSTDAATTAVSGLAASTTTAGSALTAWTNGLINGFIVPMERLGEDAGVGLGAGIGTGLTASGPGIAVATAFVGMKAGDGLHAAAALAGDRFAASLAAKMATNDAKWTAIGEGIPSGIGAGIAAKSQLVQTGMEALLDILKNGLTPARQAAIVSGKNYISDFRKGLHSGIPGAKQQAKEVGVAAIVSLHNAGSKSRAAGNYYADLLGSGMTDHQIQTALKAAHVGQAAINKMRAEAAKASGPKAVGKLYDSLLGEGLTAGQAGAVLRAGGVSSAVIKGLEKAKNQASGIGEGIVDLLANGMNARLWRLRAAAADVAAELHKALHQKSPAEVGPLSEDGGTRGWGAAAVDLMATGMRSRIGHLRGAMADVSGVFSMPSLAAADIGGSLAPLRLGLEDATARVDHYHHLDPADASRLRDAGFDDHAIGRGLLDATTLLRNRRQASLLPVSRG